MQNNTTQLQMPEKTHLLKQTLKLKQPQKVRRVFYYFSGFFPALFYSIISICSDILTNPFHATLHQL